MKKIVNTNKAPAPIGPYNQAIFVNDTLYTSGQIAMDALSGELILDNIQAETKKVMENLQVILEEVNLGFEDVIKTSIFLSDMNNFNAVNAVYGNYFEMNTAPARETVEVAKLPKNVNVEISMVAVKTN